MKFIHAPLLAPIILRWLTAFGKFFHPWFGDCIVGGKFFRVWRWRCTSSKLRLSECTDVYLFSLISGSWFRASTITTVNKIQQDAPVLKSSKKLFYSPLFRSTCFGHFCAHHQEPQLFLHSQPPVYLSIKTHCPFSNFVEACYYLHCFATLCLCLIICNNKKTIKQIHQKNSTTKHNK
jgi:hypothetical protein